MIGSGDLEFSFSGLKTAVLTLLKKEADVSHADLARAFVDAVVEVLVAKCALAMQRTGLTQLVVAGGGGANSQRRAALNKKGFDAGGGPRRTSHTTQRLLDVRSCDGSRSPHAQGTFVRERAVRERAHTHKPHSGESDGLRRASAAAARAGGVPYHELGLEHDVVALELVSERGLLQEQVDRGVPDERRRLSDR